MTRYVGARQYADLLDQIFEALDAAPRRTLPRVRVTELAHVAYPGLHGDRLARIAYHVVADLVAITAVAREDIEGVPHLVVVAPSVLVNLREQLERVDRAAWGRVLAGRVKHTKAEKREGQDRTVGGLRHAGR